MRFGNGLTFFAQTFEMESDGFAHVLFDILARAAG